MAQSNENEVFRFVVNGTRYRTRDQIENGRSLLQAAGFIPPSEHVLVQLMRPGTQSIGLDESVDLGEPAREMFRAFASDRVFTFTVDEIGYEWGAPNISEPELRDITGTVDGKVLILEREDEADEPLDEDSTVDLAALGAERLRTGKRLVIVFYGDDNPFELERRVYTGGELAKIFGVPEGYLLDLIRKGGVFDEISGNEMVKIRDGMHFVSHPPCGTSS